MSRVTSVEIEATLRAVGPCQDPSDDEVQDLPERVGEPHPFDVIAPERGHARTAVTALTARSAGASGDVDLWALTLESAVAVATRARDLDMAAALGRAAALLGPAGSKAADSAAAFIVSRRTAEGGFLRLEPEGGCETVNESTAAACARTLRTILECRGTSAQGEVERT
ncbi:hypothetical protein [Nocardiopsis sp. L17-MgMaSL7]|uniref:hypothetical protein n=1 Tax=Nocardiopsis sp. L17-MgMaSL7 TaxID=1938893 RepID=UPI000D83D09E|nr:hypothetical protein [Nocardiopsis sp. L17-MgMaSL7]PWV48522.1 hypothetical protein BDW27_11074 [Nocardiopsis sp. L17-MgMaSL7]